MLFPAIQQLKQCIDMVCLMLSNIQVRDNILEDEKYRFLFSVEEVNKLVLAGMPFRDAYKRVGLDIEQGSYNPSTDLHHTHEGSIGNLNLTEIQENMEKAMKRFEFEVFQGALEKLARG